MGLPTTCTSDPLTVCTEGAAVAHPTVLRAMAARTSRIEVRQAYLRAGSASDLCEAAHRSEPRGRKSGRGRRHAPCVGGWAMKPVLAAAFAAVLVAAIAVAVTL